ncbi:MAG: tripartite tricarboxylate transporter TctB family protein [Clostridia bacterium]
MNLPALAGIITMLVGLVYSIQAYNLPRASVGNPVAPLYFPMGLGILMIIFGAILFIKESRKGGLVLKEKAETKKRMEPATKMIVVACISSIIYALIFEKVGYVLATIFFMSTMLFTLNGKKQWKTNMIVAVCFSIGIYVIFLKLLGIPLPMMPILEI